MRAGTLRHRVRLERATITRDSHGQESKAWALIARPWAAIRPQRAKEMIDGGGTETHITHVITMRHRAGIQTTDRIVFGSRVFNIVSPVNPSERNILVEIPATEVI